MNTYFSWRVWRFLQDTYLGSKQLGLQQRLLYTLKNYAKLSMWWYQGQYLVSMDILFLKGAFTCFGGMYTVLTNCLFLLCVFRLGYPVSYQFVDFFFFLMKPSMVAHVYKCPYSKGWGRLGHMNLKPAWVIRWDFTSNEKKNCLNEHVYSPLSFNITSVLVLPNNTFPIHSYPIQLLFWKNFPHTTIVTTHKHKENSQNVNTYLALIFPPLSFIFLKIISIINYPDS